jgi:hypothetical protein
MFDAAFGRYGNLSYKSVVPQTPDNVKGFARFVCAMRYTFAAESPNLTFSASTGCSGGLPTMGGRRAGFGSVAMVAIDAAHAKIIPAWGFFAGDLRMDWKEACEAQAS